MKTRWQACGLILGALVLVAASARGQDVQDTAVLFVHCDHPVAEPALNRSLNGQPLRIGTASFEPGICVQAPCRIDLVLSPACAEFSASVGVDAAPRQKGTVVFRVLLDGREALRSRLLSQGDDAQELELPLRGAEKLSLVADSAGIIVGDMADWADAKITMGDGTVHDLATVLQQQGFIERTRRPKFPPRKGAKTCDVRSFGAKGDGQTDDSSAFQDALDALADSAQGVLEIPAGEYRLTKRLCLELRSADSARSAFVVHGAGPGATALVWESGADGFRLTDSEVTTQFTVRDMSLVAASGIAGAALDLSVPGRGVRSYRTLLVENVDIRGQQAGDGSSFATGIDASGHWRPLFRNVVVDAKRKVLEQDAAPAVSGRCGIRADWCYAPAFDHCYVWGMETGYSVVSTPGPEGPEDSSFIRCTAVSCGVGIDVYTPIPEPQLVITACHINCTEVGIRLGNRKFFSITDNLMYSSVPSETAYTDILITGRSHCGAVSGNIFHFSGRDVYRADPPSRRVNVNVAAEARDIVVTDNVFNAKGTTVVTGEGARRITVRDNQFSNVHAVGNR